MHEVEIPVSIGFMVQKLWPGRCLWTASVPPVRPSVPMRHKSRRQSTGRSLATRTRCRLSDASRCIEAKLARLRAGAQATQEAAEEEEQLETMPPIVCCTTTHVLYAS